ncbi:hypothetical protein OG883_31385 [Streptomyces sp. NBC_01142]|uniref:hypothetical protein n=1 Tax=Streptomyces sp. NBC_01142 TaxID=2975865 RepID=UPI00224D7F34|nr:hypothetical protein [Streptomyces sp. NBC_01142]MCX4824279.1 hypothetical protein [Streptomyces sp. NBC_01142]
MNLRVIGLATAVVFTVLLPLAASAGSLTDDAKPNAEPMAESEREAERGPLGGIRASGGTSGESGTSGEAGEAGASSESAADETDETTDESALSDGAGHIPPHATARCGPELASPDGVEAQTCVLTEGRDTWARTYYRNATGQELRSVLTLMAPGGRTLQTHCEVEAGDEPGACETSREPTRGADAQYSAVVEFTAGGGAEEGPLLLRSGSNSREPAGR